MAKKSMIEREKKRQKLVKQYAGRRAALKAVIEDQSKPMEDRFKATMKLAKLPRNSAAVRIKNRCSMSGRPRAFIRKFGVSRIQFRELALAGKIPGITKSSW